MKSTLPYDDGYGDSESDVNDIQFAQEVVNAVLKGGPHVAERIECIHCGMIQIQVHPFAESLECDDCGKRNVSSVPRYPDLQNLDGPL